MASGTNSTRNYLPSSESTNDTTFVVVITILGLLAVITAGLLLHLCFFHVYISFLGLTTYEYIRQQRQNQLSESISHGKLPNGSTTFQLRPVNLYCSEVKTKTTFFSCTGKLNVLKYLGIGSIFNNGVLKTTFILILMLALVI